MKTLKNLSLLLLIFLIGFYACSDDSAGPETTVAEDKANLGLSVDGLIEMLQTMQNGPAMSAMELAINLSNISIAKSQNNTSYTWYETMWDNLENVLDADLLFNDEIYDRVWVDFNYGKGHYVYNITTETWTKTADDDMVFEFPSTETAGTNDLVLTISDYSDTQINTSTETYYVPQSLNIKLLKSGTRIIEFDLASAYYNGSMGYPTSIDATAFFSPTTFDFDFTTIHPNDYKYSLAYSMTDNDHACGMSMSLLSEQELFSGYFDEMMTDNFQGDYTELNTLTASMYVDDLKFDITVDPDKVFQYLLLAETEPTLAQINDIFTATISFENAVIGTIEVKEISGEMVPCIVYKDDTFEALETVFADFITQIQPYISSVQ